VPDSTRAFSEEVVFTDSEDRLALHGLFFRPASPTASLPVLWIHGIYSEFYENAYVALGREMAGRGYVFLSANTRGHGFGAALRSPDGRPFTGGSGWERLEESPRDVGAWVDYLAASGFRRVVLGGHGLGARKAAFYAAERKDARVAGLVAASPIVVKPGAGVPLDEERSLLVAARQMVAAGSGRDLLAWPSEGCGMSAATRLDHEDPEAPFSNLFDLTGHGRAAPLAAEVTVPILAFFGSLERSPDGRDRGGELGLLRHNARSSPHVTITLIRGADHWYTGKISAVADVIAKFIMSLPSV
jgi:alpha-beta hydrolase superfamily lysophospholipase